MLVELKHAPSTLQWAMKLILVRLYEQSALVYLEGTTSLSNTIEQHLELIQQPLMFLQQAVRIFEFKISNSVPTTWNI